MSYQGLFWGINFPGISQFRIVFCVESHEISLDLTRKHKKPSKTIRATELVLIQRKIPRKNLGI